MSLTALREAVLEANLALPAHGLVKLTWGNVSGVDRDAGVVAIKASGVDYADMTVRDVVLVSLEDGRVLDGDRRPSTDTPTHVGLYRAWPQIGGVAHTHSPWATAWAQAEREIPVLGTTHADLSAEPVPLTRPLTAAQVTSGYEAETATVLVQAVGSHPDHRPAALVRGHGPFCWGADPGAAVQNAVTLEEVARIALLTSVLAADAPGLPDVVRDKHFSRKHGPDAYYGQG